MEPTYKQVKYAMALLRKRGLDTSNINDVYYEVYFGLSREQRQSFGSVSAWLRSMDRFEISQLITMLANG